MFSISKGLGCFSCDETMTWNPNPQLAIYTLRRQNLKFDHFTLSFVEHVTEVY